MLVCVRVVAAQLVGQPGVEVDRGLARLAAVADGDADAGARQHRERGREGHGGRRRGDGRRRQTDAHRAELEPEQPLVSVLVEPGEARQRAEVQGQHAARRRDVEEAGGDGGGGVEAQVPLAHHQRPLHRRQRGPGVARADVAGVVRHVRDADRDPVELGLDALDPEDARLGAGAQHHPLADVGVRARAVVDLGHLDVDGQILRAVLGLEALAVDDHPAAVAAAEGDRRPLARGRSAAPPPCSSVQTSSTSGLGPGRRGPDRRGDARLVDRPLQRLGHHRQIGRRERRRQPVDPVAEPQRDVAADPLLAAHPRAAGVGHHVVGALLGERHQVRVLAHRRDVHHGVAVAGEKIDRAVAGDLQRRPHERRRPGRRARDRQHRPFRLGARRGHGQRRVLDVADARAAPARRRRRSRCGRR